jgi:opacity protein-like surface antigen
VWEAKIYMKFASTCVVGLTLAVIAPAQEVPKVDLFFGYSFLQAYPSQSIPSFTANGGLFNFGYNFTNNIAAEVEFGGYHNGNVGYYQLDTTSYSLLAGPRFSIIGRSHRVDPYVHVLFGANRVSTSISASSVLIPIQPLPTITTIANGSYSASQWNFAMAAGGGLDIKVSRHVVLRPVQLDYYLTRFQTPDILNPNGTTQNRNQNNLRYAAGVMFNLGGEKPTPPVAMKTCPDGTQIPVDQACANLNFKLGINVTPAAICPGDTAQVSTIGNLPPGALATWTVDGKPISQNPSFPFASTGRASGSYRIGLRVTAPGYNEASADASVSVREYTPPTGTLTVSAPEIYVGDKVTLTANFTPGQCGGPLGPPSFTASEGSISGNQFDSTGVRFDPPGPTEQRKTVTFTAKVSDPRGSGTAENSVIVKQRAALAPIRLPDILFTEGSDRVNNCGKRVLLEDLKNRFEADPGGKVVFVGHIAQSELADVQLGLKRGLNAAAVISAGQGVCTSFPASQIFVGSVGAADDGVDYKPYFCAASTAERPGQAVRQNEEAKYRRVEVWFVPTGGMLPPSAKDAKDAATLGVSSLGCPR